MAKRSNCPHFVRGKRCHGITLAVHRRTIRDLISRVLGLSAPSQIREPIVTDIVIQMATLHSLWRGSDERLQDQLMNKSNDAISVSVNQTYPLIRKVPWVSDRRSDSLLFNSTPWLASIDPSLTTACAFPTRPNRTIITSEIAWKASNLSVLDWLVHHATLHCSVGRNCAADEPTSRSSRPQ